METTTIRNYLVTGIFYDKESAERAYSSLQKRGFTKDQIHLIMTDETRKKHFAHDTIKAGTKAMEGTGTGAAVGGAVGAIAAVIAGVGSALLIPGLGLVIAGPIALALAGAGAGGITGGILGALVGAGIPKERALIYEKGLNEGKIVIGVHAHTSEQATEVEDELRLYNAHDIHR